MLPDPAITPAEYRHSLPHHVFASHSDEGISHGCPHTADGQPWFATGYKYAGEKAVGRDICDYSRGRMNMLNEALEFLGLGTDSDTHGGPYKLIMPRTREEQRELAEAMRQLPGRFADRVPAHALDQVNIAAAAGRWEQAVDKLISALHDCGEAITDQEHDKLHAVLQALDMPGERLHASMGHRTTSPS